MTVLYEYDEPIGCTDEVTNFCSTCKKYPCHTISHHREETSYPPSFHDAVEHPSHYCQNGIECIEAIKASMTPEQFAAYCKGNCIKYIWRYEHKNGLEDLEKARAYLNWMIETLKKE